MNSQDPLTLQEWRKLHAMQKFAENVYRPFDFEEILHPRRSGEFDVLERAERLGLVIHCRGGWWVLTERGRRQYEFVRHFVRPTS